MHWLSIVDLKVCIMQIGHLDSQAALAGATRNEAGQQGLHKKQSLVGGDPFEQLVTACGNNRRLAEALVAYECIEHDRACRLHAITAALCRIRTYQRYNRLLATADGVAPVLVSVT